jgi:hypothetical protein
MEEEQKEVKTPKPKGGKREGAGRKAKDGVQVKLVTVGIRKDYLDIIADHYANRSEFFQKAVKEKLRRESLI